MVYCIAELTRAMLNNKPVSLNGPTGTLAGLIRGLDFEGSKSGLNVRILTATGKVMAIYVKVA